jgi:hypothetical protein
VNAGSTEVVIWMAGGCTWIENVFVVLLLRLSVTCTENENGPLLVGVPVMEPPALRISPLGSAPELIDHAYGGDPPAALSA